MLDPNLAPADMVKSISLYIDKGIPPGDFIMAVLRNNLCEAFARADEINQVMLGHIVAWLYTNAPSNCWGNPEKVEAWLGYKREMRE